ncbi:Rac/Rho-like_protein [Hexamita inflata]|uniref:Rac/Rho-like protein n=1 Tax=Hexamita inflata TaxID=28002 RepID=A0AA86RIE6_9EUKA|nr:Rac/Rho-like protein [Hexamita inflata]
MKERFIKIVLVGDNDVGKTSFLTAYYDQQFPKTVRQVSDFDSKHVVLDQYPVELAMYDTSADPEYDKYRAVICDQADLFLLCYSVVNPVSFESLLNFVNEINSHSKKPKFAILGLKTDLLNDETVLNELYSSNVTPVLDRQVEQLQKYIKAVSKFAVTSQNIADVNIVVKEAVLSIFK